MGHPTRCDCQDLGGHAGDVFSVSWHPDETKLVSGSDDGTVTVWDAAAWNRIETRRLPQPVSCATWSHDGTHFAAASGLTITVWSSDGEIVSEHTQSAEQERAVLDFIAWSPGDQRIASVGILVPLQIWNPRSDEVIRTEDVGGAAYTVTWSPDVNREKMS